MQSRKDLVLRTTQRIMGRVSRMSALVGSTVIAFAMLTAAPVQAAASTPSTIYYPVGTSACGTGSAQPWPSMIFEQSNGQGTAVTMITANVGDTIVIVNECSASLLVNNYPQGPVPATGDVALAGRTSGVDGQITFTIAVSGAGARLGFLEAGTRNLIADVMVVTSGGGGGGGGGGGYRPSAYRPAPAPGPVPATLDLALTSGNVSCRDGSAASGVVGQWLALPGAGDCTNPSRSTSKLLGWATTPDFPVSLAQRQVTNGWGAYEMTNEAGSITAVFIPAGHSAAVSGSNTLYPIWSA